MIRDLGIVQPGTLLYLPFHTFDSNDPSASVTNTGLATTDIEIFKDGSVTQRASDNGYALLDTDGIDFDGITGIHGISIDLADNSTAGFWSAGSQYWVVISSITVDAATINFVLATFRIGQPGAILNTTIATLASQTSFTLTAGPAEDDALNGCIVRIHDVASAVQAGFGVVLDYTGSTKTVTLTAGTTFTAAATDNISFFPPSNVSHIGATAQTGNDVGADVNDILADTNEVQISLAAGGLIESMVDDLQTEVDGIQADTEDIQTRLPAALVNSRMDCTIDGTGMETGAVDNILNRDASGSTTNSTLGAIVNDWENGGRLDLIVDDILVDTGTTLQGELDGIQTDTEDIQTRLPAALVGGRIDATVDGTGMEAGALALINAEVDTAFADYDPPTRTEATADKAEIITYLSGLVVAKGTIGATGNDTTHIHINGATYGNDEINNYLLVIRDVSESEWHARYIEDFTATGDLATVATLPFTPEASVDLYVILAFRQDVTGGTGLDAAGVRAAVGLASANLDTQLGDLPTNAELSTALGTADDATLAAIAALNNLSQANIRTAVGLGSANLDTQLAAIVEDTGTTLDGKLNTIDGIVDDILLDTAEIGAAGVGLTNINLPNQTMDIIGNITGNLSGSVGSVSGAVGSVTGSVGGNVTGSVGSIATDGIAAASLSTAAAQKLAHVIFRRTMTNVEASSDGDTLSVGSLYGFIQMAQESAISGATWTIYKVDGSTSLGTKTITADAAADPITAVA